MAVCRSCHMEIKLDENTRGQNGKLIPLNTDGSRHSCTSYQVGKQEKNVEFATADILLEQKTIDNVTWYVNSINEMMLRRHRIKLAIEEVDS